MRKKCVILSLVLLIAGSAALKWCLAEREREKNLQQQQQEILKSGLAKLDKVVAGQTDVHPSADIVFGENLQQELDKYRARKETVELAFTASTVCILTGGSFFAWWLLSGTARLLTKFFPRLKKFFADIFRSRREKEDKKPAKAQAKKDNKDSKQEQKSNHHKNRFSILRCGIVDPAKYSPHQLEKQLKVLTNSGWHSLNKDYVNQQEQAGPQTDVSDIDDPCSSNGDPHCDNANSGTLSAKNAEKIDVLLCDEKSSELEQPLKAAPENPNVNTEPFSHLPQGAQQTNSWDFYGESAKLEDSLKAQTENLGKHMAKLSVVTKTIQPDSLEHSEPLNNTLTELTQQVAAIREYANQQRDKVEKLQEGYDWNIIRNFCLRVIRCIDNVEGRIDRLSKQNINTKDLEEIRDELVFALESSGVEQFEPKINSDYRGQEKTSEAIQDKVHTDNPKLKGKIAKLIRSGYRYIIDEENFKVVRTAQVKLFG